MNEPRHAVHLRFPLYEVYEDGTVISFISTPKPLSPCRAGKYFALQLRNADGVSVRIYLHRLVAETFHGMPAPGQEVRHRDGITSHNGEANLRWGTRKENMHDKIEHGTALMGERHGRAKLSDREVRLIRRLCKAGIQQNRVAERFGVAQMTISRVVNKKLWRHLDG